ncbi:MAG TPA: hypothetical protein VHM90_10385 [Phycisphaerae bacterium]|nr:hypothetical protein [Phycisphaerae bacterium]
MPKCSALATVLLILLPHAARADGPAASETLSTLVEKSDLLVVCEVTRIEDGKTEKSEKWNGLITTQRATLRVLRGIQPADGAAASLEEIVVEYPAIKALQAPLNIVPPKFPVLTEGEISLLPLKKTEAGWRFISELDNAMILPAAARMIAIRPATASDYLVVELGSALLYGDYGTMGRVGKYLQAYNPGPGDTEHADPRRPAPNMGDAVFAIVQKGIGENVLRTDTRWIQMGTAVYNASGAQRPTIAALLQDDAPVGAPFTFARMAFRKAGASGLDRQIIRLTVGHQEDPGEAWNSATTIAINYANHPDLIGYERSALTGAQPGAIAVADLLIKDPAHPLAGSAGTAAREILDTKSNPLAKTVDPDTLRHAIALLIRVGGDEDFDFFLEQITRAKTRESPQYQQYLLAAAAEKLRASRAMAIARLCIDDTTPVEGSSDKSWRVCDLAATLVGIAADDDFGVKPGAIPEVKQAGVERARKYLKAKEPPSTRAVE